MIRTSAIPLLALLMLAIPLAPARVEDSLPGGAMPYTETADPNEAMMDQLHTFLNKQTAASGERRKAKWKPDFSSEDAYRDSLEPYQAALMGILFPGKKPLDRSIYRIGWGWPGLESIHPAREAFPLASAGGVTVERVTWRAFEGAPGEGLLMRPQTLRAFAVVLPDAEVSPEALLGLAEGTEDDARFLKSFPWILAGNGFAVIVPRIVDRSSQISNNKEIGRYTNQSHREFIYRMGFDLGMTLVGCELVSAAMAAEAWSAEHPNEYFPELLVGFGEGGLIAQMVRGLQHEMDPGAGHFGAVAIGGSFGPREELWREPIYRNLHGLLEGFGDAELAALIAPNPLIIDSSWWPEVKGPPEPRDSSRGAAPGRIMRPDPAGVEREFSKARETYRALGLAERIQHFNSPGAQCEFFSPQAVEAMMRATLGAKIGELNMAPFADVNISPPSEVDTLYINELQPRRVRQLIELTQAEMRNSSEAREEYWTVKLPNPPTDPAAWPAAVEPLRKAFDEEVIGKFDEPFVAPNPRMKLIGETDTVRQYLTVMDVYEGVTATGVLILPKDLKPGDRRPVVVCQHGLEGHPSNVIDKADPIYHGYASHLSDQGLITYAPQNPYFGEDRFRSLQRKANPLGKSLFSIIVAQHRQLLNWLTTLDCVDSERIAFYGISYGGKTAMRVPAIETRYCLSICSADFNEWIWKNASYDSPYSYVYTPEYEIFEWNLGRTFNYAEMASLICPRPFMVERGHGDGVAPDEWVGYEFAKVKRRYDGLGIGDRAEIEWFNGPHEIHGVGTFAFLAKHLRWPLKPIGQN